MKELYKHAVVTGGTAGIGLAVVNRLLEQGTKVYVLGRNFDSAYSEEARIAYPLVLLKCDFEDFNSVSKALDQVSEPIDLLVHSAGVVHSSYSETSNGIERMFQVNYLSNVYITEYLDARLSTHATIAFVNSEEHRKGSIDLKDPFMKSHYKPRSMYQRSKLFQMLYAAYLDSQLDYESHRRVIAMHPGIVNTGFGGKNLSGLKKWWWELYGTLREGISAGEAADTIMTILQYDRNNLGLYYKEAMKSEPSKTAQDLDVANEIYAFSQDLLANRL